MKSANAASHNTYAQHDSKNFRLGRLARAQRPQAGGDAAFGGMQPGEEHAAPVAHPVGHDRPVRGWTTGGC